MVVYLMTKNGPGGQGYLQTPGIPTITLPVNHQEKMEESAAFPITMASTRLDFDGSNDWIENKFQIKALILGWIQVDLSTSNAYRKVSIVLLLICCC